MPTAIKSVSSDLNDAVEQVTKVPARIVETGKRTGNIWIDACDKTAAAARSAGRKSAEQPLDAVRTLVEAQAGVASEIVKTHTAVAREVLSV